MPPGVWAGGMPRRGGNARRWRLLRESLEQREAVAALRRWHRREQGRRALAVWRAEVRSVVAQATHFGIEAAEMRSRIRARLAALGAQHGMVPCGHRQQRGRAAWRPSGWLTVFGRLHALGLAVSAAAEAVALVRRRRWPVRLELNTGVVRWLRRWQWAAWVSKVYSCKK